jgi:hypothetical protein
VAQRHMYRSRLSLTAIFQTTITSLSDVMPSFLPY